MFTLFAILFFCKNTGNQSAVFYLSGDDFLSDTLNTQVYARELNPYGYSETQAHVPFKDGNYPPLAYLIFYVLNQFCLDNPFGTLGMVIACLFMLFSFLALFAACQPLTLAPQPRSIGVCLALFLSGTALFSFERGNIIALTAALCAFYLAGYASKNRVIRELAFMALAIAAALKIFPALFGLLLVAERRWKDALRLMLYGLIATFLPFLFLKGGFANLPLLMENFGAHTEFYQKRTYPRFGFRLFSSLTYDLCWSNPWLERNVWKLGEALLAVMPWVDLILSGLCLACVCLKKERWKKAAAIVLVLLNYPVNSGAYTALYLFPVIVLYLSCDTLSKKDLWYLAAFLLILSPVQIPLPYESLGMIEGVMVNLSDIIRALAAYLLFMVFAIQGAAAGVRYAEGRRAAQSRDNCPSVTSV